MSAQRRLFVFINIGHVLAHMFMLIFPTAILAMGSAFDMPYGKMLSLSLGGFIAFGAGSLPAGWLGDAWDRRTMLGIFFLGIGACSIATGMAKSVPALSLGLTGIGLFAAIYHPVGTALLVANAKQLGRAIGINGVWGNLGIAVAAVLTGALTRWLGWRAAFVLPGAFALLCGVLFLVLVPGSVARSSPSRVGTLDRALPRATVLRAFTSLVVLTVAGGLVFNAATLAMPKMFSDKVAMLKGSPIAVGLLVSSVYVIGASSQLIVGRLVDRLPLRKVLLPLACLQTPCLWAATRSSDWSLVLAAVVLMFAVFGQVTVNDAMVAKYTNEKYRARAFAIRYLVSFGASAASVPLVGVLHDRTGNFSLTFEVLAIVGCTIAAAALWFPSGTGEHPEPSIPANDAGSPAVERSPVA